MAVLVDAGHLIAAAIQRRALLRRAGALALALSLAVPGSGQADEALIAVAANFEGAAKAIARAFEAETGHGVTLTTGSTGKLYAQIRRGAPVHAMLSADPSTPARLAEDGPGIAATRFTYARGSLVLWSADPDHAAGDARAALTAPGLRRLAIANPDLAPYGAAAREALGSMGLWRRLRERIVMGQNVGQTFSLVASGAAQLGIVAASSVAAPGAPEGRAWPLPARLHAPIRQDAILLAHGRDSTAARGFLEFLKGAEAATIARRFGYAMGPE